MQREKVTTVTNKYGIKVDLPPVQNTTLECQVEDILNKLDVEYVKQFYFDETGFRKIKYDFAVMKNLLPALFIECDGESHYSSNFYLAMGNRPERNMAHITQSLLSDAEKTKLAYEREVPLLRVNKLYNECLKELIMSYVSVFIDGNVNKTKEIQMLDMFDKYGPTFPYIEPSSPSKAVKEKLNTLRIKGDSYE